MAKPQRFPDRIEFWTTPEQAEAIARLGSSGIWNRSDHLRFACELYLQRLTPRAAPNAQPQQHGEAAPNAQHQQHQEAV